MRDQSETLQVVDAAGSKRARSRSGSRSSTGGKSDSGRKKSKFTNADLPFGLASSRGQSKNWRNTFCHTMFEFMGVLDDPWNLEDCDVQVVWNIVYPELPHTIVNTEAVYAVVSVKNVSTLHLPLTLFDRLDSVSASGEVNSRRKRWQ